MNFTYTDSTGTIECKNGGVVLRQDKKYPKNIGTIYKPKNDKVWVYRKDEKEKDVFRKNNSWSICWEVMKYLSAEDKIIFETERGYYGITKAEAVRHGTFLWFKKVGVEKKLYVPLKHWRLKLKE